MNDFDWEWAGLETFLQEWDGMGFPFLLHPGMGRDGIFFLGPGWDGSENSLPCHALMDSMVTAAR